MGTQYSHLSETDRVAIEVLLQAEFSCRAIARQMGYSASTILPRSHPRQGRADVSGREL
jgi:IS30 family transposase